MSRPGRVRQGSVPRRSRWRAVTVGDWVHVAASVAFLVCAGLPWIDLGGYGAEMLGGLPVTGLSFLGVIVATVLLLASGAWAILPALASGPVRVPFARHALTVACTLPAFGLTLAVLWEVWLAGSPEWPAYGCGLITLVTAAVGVGQNRADVHLRITWQTNRELVLQG